MRIENITHNHLRKLIEKNQDFFTGDGDISDDDFIQLYLELFYSTFIVPTKNVDGKDYPMIMADENMNRFVPVFSDLTEYQIIFSKYDDITPKFYDFDSIMECSDDLIVLNPSSEACPFHLDVFDDKEKIPMFPHKVSERSLKKDDLKKLADSQNDTFKDYIKDPGVIYDYENFFKRLAETSFLMKIPLKNPKIEDGIIDLRQFNTIDINHPKGIIEIYTSKNEIRGDATSYVSVINLDFCLESMIRNDFNGVVINPNSDNLMLNREMILENFDDFHEIYDSEKFGNATIFAFLL